MITSRGGMIWGPAALRFLRAAASKATDAMRTKLANASKPLQALEYIPIRSGFTGRRPIHPTAVLKQQRRWFTRLSGRQVQNAVRRFISTEASGAGRQFDRAKLPSSNTSRRVAQWSGRAPFASTLRPNLTGGAMPRTAGGYSLGGGARYFSHTPAAPAQVVQNVSQAMRAFFLSGQRLQYDGIDARGQIKYRSVSVLEDKAIRKLADIPRSAPGAFIDFQLSPTITALSPLAMALASASEDMGLNAEDVLHTTTLNTEGLLDVLSADFGRALKDLTAVYADLRRLSSLGDLPISLEKRHVLRVRFPGLDNSTLEQICDDVGIQRGIVGQDAGFDSATGVTMALKFPFAPQSNKLLSSPGGTARSLEGHELDEISTDDSFVREAFAGQLGENPWLSDPEGYESMSPPLSSGEHCSGEFEGLEGIYRFLEECDRAHGRLG